MPEVILSSTERFIRAKLQHYNEVKYWKYRSDVISCGGRGLKTLICKLKLLYIKRCDAFNNATLGTHLGYGATFAGIPRFPHGLYGIIITHNAIIGENATIFHHVTIGQGKGGAPKIGDDVTIGAGAIIIGNITAGNRVKIGAGCVVAEDIPDDSTVVMEKPKIIRNKS